MKGRLFFRTFLSLGISLSVATPPSFAAAGPVALITPAQAQNLYRNLLENHWVPDTGLFLSFPDSSDQRLSQQASTYEQGAVGLLALRLGDLERARGIFQFLKNTWTAEPQRPERAGLRGLSNFYNAYFGAGGIEKTVHLGPNAWAGLFAARYANTAGDAEALQWAQDVAYWMANSLPHQGGAVAMGPRDAPHGAPWAHILSTENNISYYAMLTELLRSPKIDVGQRVALTQERDRVENWLLRTAFDRKTYRICRGINPHGVDSIQALDTTTWLISALGPRKLSAHGIDPDRLMAQAAQAYEVTVGGETGVDATDQAEADFIFNNLRNAQGQPARPAADHHRLIWYEGLGQYVLALATMADEHERQGRADEAARELAKARALIQTFDRAALKRYGAHTAYPYASAGRFFRDGWETQAQAANGAAASSLIAATWRAFAGLGWDPLAGRAVSSIESARVTLPKVGTIVRNRPAVLYGSSEEMVVNAWRALGDNHIDDAIEQAQATVQEWSSWAMRLQDKKAREIGHLVSYSGDAKESKQIFDYWALNDVGAAYFVLGKAYDAKHEYAKASQAFEQVINRYSLAQVWDPKGWFWSPLEAIQSDFVQRDPAHYGAMMPQASAGSSAQPG